MMPAQCTCFQITSPELHFHPSYQLVTFTDNYEEYLSAMGTSQSLMWMAKAFDERFSTSEVAADGVLTWRWKLTWKWCKLTTSFY